MSVKKKWGLSIILIFNFLIFRFAPFPLHKTTSALLFYPPPPGYCYTCSQYNKRFLSKKTVSESCLCMWNSCTPRAHSWSLESVSFLAFWAYIILALCNCNNQERELTPKLSAHLQASQNRHRRPWQRRKKMRVEMQREGCLAKSRKK